MAETQARRRRERHGLHPRRPLRGSQGAPWPPVSQVDPPHALGLQGVARQAVRRDPPHRPPPRGAAAAAPLLRQRRLPRPLPPAQGLPRRVPRPPLRQAAPFFRFPDSEFYDFDDNDLWGHDAPDIEASRVDYRKMEKENYVEGFKQTLLVHTDPSMVISSSPSPSVRTSSTPRRATGFGSLCLENLGDLRVVGFYEHVSSGDYRVLCLTGRRIGEEEPTCWYHVLHVSHVQLRYIGRPISPAAPEDQGLAYGVELPCISPPIQFKRNHHLHWPPQDIQRHHIHMLVFDTEREEFSWKRPPPVGDHVMRLLEFPNGDLGLSLSRTNKPTMELWRLVDYENEVWVPVYRIQLALQQMPRGVLRPLDHFWIPAVVSPEGDVLIQSSTNWVLHYDRNGNLLRQFWFHESATALPIRHELRESLLPHPMFRAPKVDGATEPPFFLGLCSDPSS